MQKKLINSAFIIPLLFSISPSFSNSNQLNHKLMNIEELLAKKEFIDISDIKDLIIANNIELKSLEKLVKSSSFNVSSKISKRYPKLDLSANGLPKYLYGENYNSNSANTKSSQFTANPSLTIKWDLIDPQRGLEIKSARQSYEIARNNYEIKKRDLIQEGRAKYHEYQKLCEDINNARISVELSLNSLKDAQSKLDSGIGTKFDVLEAEAELARDKQLLEEKKTLLEIIEISIKEILNIKNEVLINKNQKIQGVWDHSPSTNINNAIKNSLSLKNITIQNKILANQANIFRNANKPNVFISNTLSSTFTKGDYLATEINSQKYNSSYNNTISLNFSWNFFNGGININASKAKLAEAESGAFEYEIFKNRLIKNINESILNLNLNLKNIHSAQKEIDSSKESLRLARLRYEVGIATLKDILLRQKELSIARTKNINAIFNYNINLDKLERLTFLKTNKYCSKMNTDNQDKIYSLCKY